MGEFKINKKDLKPIAVGYGACYATDLVMKKGMKVGYMYREEPSDPMNGWVFMSGTESQEYMDDADNIAIYDTNTVANYDPKIIPFIECPVGTECERTADGKLQIIQSNT